MRTLRLIGSVIMVIMMSLNFIACSDDDENDNRPLAEKLIGHWVLTYEEGFEKDFEHPEYDEAWSHAPKDECEYFGNFTFREDGTYSEYDLYYIENWTMVFDMKILILTIFKGFFDGR